MIEGNIMTTSADCDDYTWQEQGAERRSGVAVFNGTVSEATQYNMVAVDLRTPDQREREDVAALNMRIDNLVDAVEYLAHRVAELERAAVTVKG